MNKNRKILLTLIFLTFILSINTACAADTDNNRTTDTITQQSSIESTLTVQKEMTPTDTKVITKSNKQDVKKESTTQIDVNNYDEMVSQVNNIQQGSEKEFTINLKPGDYNATANMTLKQNNGINYKLIINGNNIELNGQNKHTFMEISQCSLELRDITLSNFETVVNGRGI